MYVSIPSIPSIPSISGISGVYESEAKGLAEQRLCRYFVQLTEATTELLASREISHGEFREMSPAEFSRVLQLAICRSPRSPVGSLRTN
jgi:hypothetical protein